MASYNKIDERTWKEKIRFFKNNFSPCKLCPRACSAERELDKPGVCKADKNLRIASYNLHFGEEPPVSGSRGSGTIFFSGCTLSCIFCQNFPISQLNNGTDYTIDKLSSILLELQNRGAHNINLVSPTPYLYHFISALRVAARKGLEIPIVYNSGGYESVEIINELDDIVDIYLPDYKYSDDEVAKKYSGISDYSDMAFNAISEMYRQVGSLVIDEDGIAIKGVIIRHLILPGHVKNSINVLKKISESSFKGAYLSLMSQFFPAHNASCDIHLKRRLKPEEYKEVRSFAIAKKLENGWFQEI